MTIFSSVGNSEQVKFVFIWRVQLVIHILSIIIISYNGTSLNRSCLTMYETICTSITLSDVY